MTHSTSQVECVVCVQASVASAHLQGPCAACPDAVQQQERRAWRLPTWLHTWHAFAVCRGAPGRPRAPSVLRSNPLTRACKVRCAPCMWAHMVWAWGYRARGCEKPKGMRHKSGSQCPGSPSPNTPHVVPGAFQHTRSAATPSPLVPLVCAPYAQPHRVRQCCTHLGRAHVPQHPLIQHHQPAYAARMRPFVLLAQRGRRARHQLRSNARRPQQGHHLHARLCAWMGWRAQRRVQAAVVRQGRASHAGMVQAWRRNASMQCQALLE